MLIEKRSSMVHGFTLSPLQPHRFIEAKRLAKMFGVSNRSRGAINLLCA